MENKVRAALIGVGNMGKKYAEMIVEGQVPHMILTAVVIRRESLLPWGEALVNTDGSRPKIYADTDKLFAEPDGYDAVLIVTPHKLHPTLAKQAFALGKHVLCDKPAGAAVSEAMEMTRASKEADRLYGMIFHQRCYPKYRKMKEMLQNGELGRISRVMLVNSRYFRTSYYHASGSWRSSWRGEGGGALINQGQHILDIWQWLFGMPEKIYADIPYGKYNDFAVDDEATISMHYKDGMTGVFMLSTGEAIWEERMEIVGTKGKLLMENETLHIWKYDQDSAEYMKTAQVNSRDQLHIEEEVISYDKRKEPYTEILENFAEAVLTQNAALLIAPGENAVNPLMLANASYLSAWKQEAVALPIDAAEYDREVEKHLE